jgi:hypothetical protein
LAEAEYPRFRGGHKEPRRQGVIVQWCACRMRSPLMVLKHLWLCIGPLTTSCEPVSRRAFGPCFRKCPPSTFQRCSRVRRRDAQYSPPPGPRHPPRPNLHPNVGVCDCRGQCREAAAALYACLLLRVPSRRGAGRLGKRTTRSTRASDAPWSSRSFFVVITAGASWLQPLTFAALLSFTD